MHFAAKCWKFKLGWVCQKNNNIFPCEVLWKSFPLEFCMNFCFSNFTSNLTSNFTHFATFAYNTQYLSQTCSSWAEGSILLGLYWGGEEAVVHQMFFSGWKSELGWIGDFLRRKHLWYTLLRLLFDPASINIQRGRHSLLLLLLPVWIMRWTLCVVYLAYRF